LVMEPRESWARSSSPSGPTHRDSRTREDRYLRQYDGLPTRNLCRRLFRRLLRGGRELTWVSRAIAEVASMVAAISATDGNISLVIQFLHEANSVCLLSGDGEAIRPIQATNSHVASTPREVGVSHNHESRSLVRHLRLTRAASVQLGVEVSGPKRDW